jgi:hypothetical protein
MVFFHTSGFWVSISITSDTYQAPYQAELGWSEKFSGADSQDTVGSLPFLHLP